MDSRDKKEPQEISESLEKALHLMEQTGDESPEDIKRQMDDPETLEACKLLYKYKNAMGRRAAAKPDVGAVLVTPEGVELPITAQGWVTL